MLDAVLSAYANLFVAENDLVRLDTHSVSLQGAESDAAGKIEAVFRAAGFVVPSVAEALKAAGIDAARARTLLDLMLRQGRLVRVSPDLVYHRETLAKVRTALSARKGQSFTVPEFKDWTGISRKYAIPLLEYFDRERVTRRLADKRVVL
jgi:selenocysteine-specific elongation factor